MQLKRRIIMVGATFLLAAATGHLMQGGSVLPNFGSSPAPQKVAAAPAAKPAPATADVAKAPMIEADKPVEKIELTKADPAAPAAKPAVVAVVPATPVVPAVAALAAMPMLTNVLVGELAARAKDAAADMEAMIQPVATRSDAQPTDLPETSFQAAPAPDCTAVLTLSPAPAAMIDVSLNAPCDANARVVIRHAGLAVTGVTSQTGLMQATIPALAADALVVVALPNGVKAQADIQIPSLVDYDRFAVQWQGGDHFELHAFEFGADYGEEGHVSATNPRVPTVALQATGGFLMELGDRDVQLPMLAEVYTFPTRRSQRAGDVELTIEAQVAAATCGREMLGETLEAHAGQPVKVVELSLEMPGCDGLGDYVILNNLLPGVKVAGN